MAQAQRLTALRIKSQKPDPDGRLEIPDGGCPGLYLLVQPSGTMSWALRYRHLRKPKKFTLGAVLVLGNGEAEPGEPAVGGALTLAGAHKLAKDALHRVKQGIDPAEVKQAERRAGNEAAAARAEDSVENLAAQFIERYSKAKGNRSWRSTEAIFNKTIVPAWKGRTVHQITQDDVEHLVDRIAEQYPIAANRLLSVVRKWFSWMSGRHRGGKKALLRQRIRNNPTLGVEPPGKETKCDRVLSDDEVKQLWSVAGEIGGPVGAFIRMLILTGQRRSEVAGMRLSELDLEKGTWTIASERSKNKLAHVVLLTPQALDIIRALPAIYGSDFVFSKTGQAAVNGHSRAKRLIDGKMQTAKPWTYHDVRRTCATGMAKIGVMPHVIEAVLNHASGSAKSGVAGIYNQWSYFPEKCAALVKWADHVEQLVTGKPAGKVVKLPSRRR
jgi:integrase